MNRGSLPTESFVHLNFSVFICRLTKSGFADTKSLRVREMSARTDRNITSRRLCIILFEVVFHSKRAHCIFIYEELLERTGEVDLNEPFIQMTIEFKICLNIACHRPV